MNLNTEYLEIPLEEICIEQQQDVNSIDEEVQGVVEVSFCDATRVKSYAIKGTVTTGGAIGGAALGSIPTIIFIAIAYLGMELSGKGSLAPGNYNEDMTKVTIGIILTLGAGFAALVTGAFLPLYGAFKGGVAGWEKGQQICEKYLTL